MQKNVLFIFFSLVAFFSSAQNPNGNAVFQKIDSKFYRFLLEPEEGCVFSNLETIIDSTCQNINGEKYFHCKVFSNKLELLKNNNAYKFGSFWPTFATAWLTKEQIIDIASRDYISYIEAPIRVNLLNDFNRAISGVDVLQAGGLNNTIYNGNGVIIGVIDAGIDWTHADFISTSSSTSSRLLNLWDQNLTKIAGENTPFDNDASLSSCNYGVEYVKTEIDAELASSSGSIRNASTNNHGTHVTGTAAGNGNSLSPAQHIGMAPNADIMFVNTSFSDVGIIDALAYLSKKADDEGKPIVINLSLGGDYNPHDGSAAMSLAIDAISGNGKIVVCAAGNEADDFIHISGTVNEGGSTTIDIIVPAYTPNAGASNDYFQITVWYRNADSVTASLEGPNGSISTNLVDAYTGIITAFDGTVIMENSVYGSNGDRFLDITVYDYTSGNPPAAGTYTLTLNNLNASPPYSRETRFHAWLYSKTVGTISGADNTYIIGSPASAASAITVGSYVHKWRWSNYLGSSLSYSGTDLSDNISAFSSVGPLRYGQPKPDIAAPGQGVVSTLSSFATANANRRVTGEMHFVNQGTSMASPTVAGSVALLLQQNAALNSTQIKTILQNTAEIDAFTGAVPNNTWGGGKLDLFSAMVETINSSLIAEREIFDYDNWIANSSVSLNGTNILALKFSPSFTGKLSNVFFHTGTSAISLSGDIEFAVYSNNSGVPGTKIGSSFYYDDALISKNTWHSAINSATINLSSSNDYFLVITLANSADTWSLLAENNDVDNRSLVYNGSVWTTQSYDFRIRPVNVFSDGLGLLPVSLTYFKAQWIASTTLSNHASDSLSNHASDSLSNHASDSLNNHASDSLSNLASTSFGTSSEKDPERSQSSDTERSRSGRALLIWQTAAEENNSHFMIERSFDGLNFESIGRVEGNGTSFKTRDYTFIDNSPQPAVNSPSTIYNGLSTIYYRLKQVDFNGQYEYSYVRTLNAQLATRSSLTLFPNPNNGTEVYLSETGNYAIYSIQGILLGSYLQTQKIDISGLVKGTYIIQDDLGAHQVLIKQ